MINFGFLSRTTGRIPGSFESIWTKLDQEPETTISLPKIKIKDIPDNSTVTASAGITFLINGEVATTISDGDRISAFIESGDYGAVVTGYVTIGGTSCNISVTSRGEYVDDMSQSSIDSMSQDDIDVLQQFGA